MDDQPEATVRAGHTGHGRVLFEGEFFACFAFNKDHRGAPRVWFDGMPMTDTKGAARPEAYAEAHVAQVTFVEQNMHAPVASGIAPACRFGTRRRRIRKAPPRHAHQDPAGAEWLAKVGAT